MGEEKGKNGLFSPLAQPIMLLEKGAVQIGLPRTADTLSAVVTPNLQVPLYEPSMVSHWGVAPPVGSRLDSLKALSHIFWLPQKDQRQEF